MKHCDNVALFLEGIFNLAMLEIKIRSSRVKTSVTKIRSGSGRYNNKGKTCHII